MAISAPSFWHAVLNRRMFICIFLGFSSGFPLYVLLQLLPAWMRTEGVGLTEIGFFTLIQFPYSWKFVWSPLLDCYSLPFLGRRRGWMLVSQMCVMVSVAAMGMINPALSLWAVVYLAIAMAFFSATQDIVIDAYRRELLPDIELGLGNTIHVQAYRLSGLVPGALSLILADYLPWQTVFVITAAFMLISIVMTLSIREAVATPPVARSLRKAVVEPFKEFIQRQGAQTAMWLLAFMFFYKLGDNMATALVTPFYLDMGFTLTQIGTIAKTASLVAVIVGGLAGGLMMVMLGINRSLWLFGAVQMVTILGFVVLSQIGANAYLLGMVVALEYLGVGLGMSALTGFIARATHPVFAATQFALFTAFVATPRTLVNASAGILVELLGWTYFFWLCAALAVPGMLLLLKVAPWSLRGEASYMCSRPEPDG